MSAPGPYPTPTLESPVTTRSLPRLLSLLLAALLVLAGTLAGAGAASAATDGPTGWLRVGHLSPGTPKAEVRLTPFSGGEPTTLTEATYGELSGYERLPVGTYTVALLPEGRPDASPMLSRSVEVTEGGARTVVATGEGDDVRATVLDDDLTPPAAGQAKVRLLSAATGPDAVDADVVGGPSLATDLATGSATGYAEVPAQQWDVRLSATGGDGASESRVPVRAGGVYTLVALDAPQGGLRLRAVKDSGGSTESSGAMPSGGMDTGGGGLADAGSVEAPGTAAPLAAGALLALAGAVVVRRRAAPA